MIAGASTIELGTESKWQIGLPSVGAPPTGVYKLATTLEMLQGKLMQACNARTQFDSFNLCCHAF
jgi:hypothetical protein